MVEMFSVGENLLVGELAHRLGDRLLLIGLLLHLVASQ